MAKNITATIRKLLAQANGTDNAAEAQAFTDRATELMLKHQIDDAEIGDGETPSKIGVYTVTVRGYPKQKGTLMSAIALAFDCKVVRQYGGYLGKGANQLTVYGWESDLESVKTLFASLELQATAQAERGARESWDNARSYKTSFLHGFAVQVGRRLQAQRNQVRSDVTTGTALVLRDRSQAVRDHVDQEHPGLQKATQSKLSSRAGLRGGVAAGDRADLGGHRLAGERTAVTR